MLLSVNKDLADGNVKQYRNNLTVPDSNTSNTCLLHDPAISPLTLYIYIHTHTPQPKELKACVHKKTCTKLFTAVLFGKAKKQKQLKWSSTVKQISKMWLSHTMEYYSTVKCSTDTHTTWKTLQWKKPVRKDHRKQECEQRSECSLTLIRLRT